MGPHVGRRIGFVLSAVVVTCLAVTIGSSAPAVAVGATQATIVVVTNPTNVVTGQPITLTATVSGPSGTPTGTVTFSAYSAGTNAPYTLCVAPVQQGTASCQATNLMGTLQPPEMGSASYSGDSTYAADLQYFNINAALANDTISLASSANPALPGQDITITATISLSPPATFVPAPQSDAYVQFMVDPNTVNGYIAWNGPVSATAPTATGILSLPAGTYTIQAQLFYGYGEGLGDATATMTQYVAPPPHGYWLVGGDGGIFTFGSAQFYGSTGSTPLSRPVVGITPTADDGGYWLVASDGGIFSFGDAGFHGSIPGLGILPAGTPGNGRRLNAPVVGMVPSTDGGGYFMVASDGGVFAFGDASFEGSCPAIGGCAGAAVAVMPDASGDGYWLVTATGHVYGFGDASYFGAPGPQSAPVTAAVRTPNGGGYWILLSNGEVFSYGDATNYGGLPGGLAGGSNPANAIFSTSDGGGYWIGTANGAVYPEGDAPNDGSMAGTHLNAPIIAAVGW
jgi:hypothetical protein